jgi:hypothetical protein
MTHRTLRLSAALAVAATLLAANASAQKVSFSLQKQTHHGTFGLSIGSSCAPHWRPCPPSPVWVPGHWQTCSRRVWVPESCRREWVAPIYEDRKHAYGPGCWKTVPVCVRPGYWTDVRTPGHFEMVTERVWVAGAWRAG